MDVSAFVKTTTAGDIETNAAPTHEDNEHKEFHGFPKADARASRVLSDSFGGFTSRRCGIHKSHPRNPKHFKSSSDGNSQDKENGVDYCSSSDDDFVVPRSQCKNPEPYFKPENSTQNNKKGSLEKRRSTRIRDSNVGNNFHPNWSILAGKRARNERRVCRNMVPTGWMEENPVDSEAIRRRIIDMRDFVGDDGSEDHEEVTQSRLSLNPRKIKAEHCKGWNQNSSAKSSIIGISADNTNHWVSVLRAKERSEERDIIVHQQKFQLRWHQCEGVRFMWDNLFLSERIARAGHCGWGCILCHVCGLGKTAQALTFADAVMGDDVALVNHTLIVVPVNVTSNWRRECSVWLRDKTPRYSILSSNKGKLIRETVQKWKQSGGIIIVGYEMFREFVNGKCVDEELKHDMTEVPGMLILDEAHSLRGGDSSLLHALKLVKTRRRILLTGTPIQNNLKEYYHVIDFARPNFLGSSEDFAKLFRRYIQPTSKDRSLLRTSSMRKKSAPKFPTANERVFVLRELTEGFIHRRNYSCLQNELPELFDVALLIRLTLHQRIIYNHYLEGKPATAQEEKVNRCYKSNTRSLFESFWESSRICSEPANLEAVETLNSANFKHSKTVSDDSLSGKAEVTLAIVTMVRDRGEKAIIFSQRLKALDLLGKKLQDSLNLKSSRDLFRIDGGSNGQERQSKIDQFNEEGLVLLASTKAGCLGTNITGANHVILFDVSWNPAQDIQALHRAYRIGQKRPVYVYRMVAQDTLEEIVYRRQLEKRTLADQIIDCPQDNESDEASFQTISLRSLLKHSKVVEEKLLSGIVCRNTLQKTPLGASFISNFPQNLRQTLSNWITTVEEFEFAEEKHNLTVGEELSAMQSFSEERHRVRSSQKGHKFCKRRFTRNKKRGRSNSSKRHKQKIGHVSIFGSLLFEKT